MPPNYSPEVKRLSSKRARRYRMRLHFEYQRLEPRQLLAAVQGHVSPSANQHDSHDFGYGYVSSTQIEAGHNHNFQQVGHDLSSSIDRSTQSSIAPQGNVSSQLNDSNSQPNQSQLQSQIPTTSPTQATSNFNLTVSTQAQTSRPSNASLISTLPRSLVAVDVTTLLQSRWQNANHETYGQSEGGSVQDTDDDLTKLRQLAILRSGSDSEMLASGIESATLAPNRLDEFFSASFLDEDSGARLGSELTNDVDLLDAIARELESLNSVLSELDPLIPFNSTDEATEPDGDATHRESQEPPYDSPTSRDFGNSFADQNASKVSATSDAEQREPAFELANIANGGIVMLIAEEMTAVDQIDWMIDFVAGQQKSAEATVNRGNRRDGRTSTPIEMSVGVVQAFDLGRRETQQNLEESAAVTSSAE